MKSLFGKRRLSGAKTGALYDSKRYAMLNRWDPRHMVTVASHLDPRAGERILEVGCGRGHLTKRLRDLGADAVGIDANPHAAAESVTEGVTTGNAEALDYPDASFDKIVSVHAIEHIPNIEAAFSEMARVLKPGGKALFIYPAEPIQGIWAVPTAIVLHGNPLRARDVHCNWLWPSKVRGIAEPRGLVHDHSSFMLLSSPQFVSVFSKP
ncbi:MAG: class I SAM-dependent methyltransferase [Acidimicrobiia bacterium]|nr:class I SAM-dependent methyltransferase [Acidimicrobiia bacterium]MDH5420321.1 class I SAM-dependent methyltransferase [Acidimicrobiia bacterium]MDH5503446.1 class I SAM-dependent methyltransferase [Acidimicrobiia bacterium]